MTVREDLSGFKERTLVAVKPDGVQRRLIGDIIKRFEQRGFRLVGLKMLQASDKLLAQHYVSLQKKPFYSSLLYYMTTGPVVAMVWEGHNVVRSSRMLVGDTDPAEALPGTIRGDFSVHISRSKSYDPLMEKFNFSPRKNKNKRGTTDVFFLVEILSFSNLLKTLDSDRGP
ncbi:nucleoside diphosphate kinase B isoform a [Pimephales promelas]|nr:nucleoside diphosphate kinase B isoform a [Pimephales promelas]